MHLRSGEALRGRYLFGSFPGRLRNIFRTFHCLSARVRPPSVVPLVVWRWWLGVGGWALVIGRWWSGVGGWRLRGNQMRCIHLLTVRARPACCLYAPYASSTTFAPSARRRKHSVQSPWSRPWPDSVGVGPNNFRLIASSPCFDMNRNAGRWILYSRSSVFACQASRLTRQSLRSRLL